MKKALLFLCAILCTILSSCEKTETSVQQYTYRINHYEQATADLGSPKFALLYQEPVDFGTEKWTPLPHKISGFEFEPGYIYDIDVLGKRIIDRNGTTDNNFKGETYKLKTISSKTAVANDMPFEVNLRSHQINLYTGTNTAELKILNKTAIDCGTLCTPLASAIASNAKDIIGKFKRKSDGSYLLIELN